MKARIKKTFFRTMLFLNISCVILLILSDLATIANPTAWWPIALLGVVFPLLLTATFIFVIFWLLVKSKRVFISLMAILISLPNIITTFGFNNAAAFKQTKNPDALRVLTWNVALMNYTEVDTVKAIKNNAVIFKKLREADADIICLQEFFSAVIPGNHYNLMDSIARTMNYPYHYFSLDNPKWDSKFYNGSIIFSRYKIVDTQKIVYPKTFIGSIIKTGILVNGDTIDVFTTRLQSVKFKSKEYKQLNAIKTGSESAFKGSKNIVQKLRAGYRSRIEQVMMAKKFIEESKRPVIFTGDLNDVPVSYTYSTLKNNMNDAWVKKGYGLGKTFKYISPTLRIDHIFFNDAFKATQVKRIFSSDESDHYGIIADLFLIKKGT